MNIEILKKYNIEFINRIDEGKLEKIPNKGHDLIAGYLLDMSVRNITEWAIPEIDKVINGILNDTDVDSTPVWAEVFLTNTILRNAWDNTKFFQLPTVDFKQILLSWAEFLDTPPLMKQW